LTYYDLLAMGMTEAEARAQADPNNPNSVNKQISLLEGNETFKKQRIGAFALSRPDHVNAFMVVGQWKVGDEMQYLEDEPSLPKKILLRVKLARTLALLSFVSDTTLSPEERMGSLEPLMTQLTQQADDEHREIRGSYYPADFSSELYFDNGFEVVPNRQGKPVGNIVQNLISRKPR